MSQRNDSVQQVLPERIETNVLESMELMSVAISKNIHERIRKRLTKAEFTTVDSYVSYVLEQVLSELESEDSKNSIPQATSENPFSKEDQEGVEQRLRDLGYL